LEIGIGNETKALTSVGPIREGVGYVKTQLSCIVFIMLRIIWRYW